MSNTTTTPTGVVSSTELGELLHVAICQAVALMNRSPGVASCIDGREAREILRNALVAYADAYMDQPVTEVERNKVARKHQRSPNALLNGAR